MKTFLHALVATLIFTRAASAQYAIDWITIDGGGGTSSGGTFAVSGTIGQPDAGTMNGGSYTLQGGFWPGIIIPSAGDAPTLFIELSGAGVVIRWSPAIPGFALEETDSLSALLWSPGPSGNPTPPISAGTGTRFYRLRK